MSETRNRHIKKTYSGRNSKASKTQKERNDRKDRSSKHDGAFNSANSAHGTCNYDSIRSNDVAWYDKAKFLFNEATRVPFDAIAGAPRSYRGSGTSIDPRSKSLKVTTTAAAVPGIMRIDFAPTIGWSDSLNSPINRAFTSLYGDLASKTTGAMQFTQGSLALFTTSMCSIAAMIGVAKRMMEVSFLYSPQNYYYPVDLLTSMLGSESAARAVINNRDMYRARLNDLIFQFNNFRIPHFVAIFQRQYSLCHNIYADEDSVQAQIMYFMPTGYYKYSDTENKLQYVHMGMANDTDYGYTIEQYFTAIQEALDQWRHSSDLPLINGALQRAYPDSNFVKLDMIMPDSAVVPVYDRNMLWQINNMRTAMFDKNSMDITEDVVQDIIVCKPYANWVTAEQAEYNNRQWVYLNSNDGNESSEFIMEATRLIPFINFTLDEGTFKSPLTNVCSEIPVRFHIYARNEVLDEDSVPVSTLDMYTFSSNPGTNLGTTNTLFAPAGVITSISLLSRWKHAPRVDFWGKHDALFPDRGWFYLGTFGDLHDYTYLYQEQLDSLNTAALQSLYWVEDMNLRV